MITTLCFVAIVIAYLAALGRSASPRAELVPWGDWSKKDWVANVGRGMTRLVELQNRNPLGPHHAARLALHQMTLKIPQDQSARILDYDAE